MPNEQQPIPEDFKITIGGFQEGEYRVALLEVIKRLALPFIVSMPLNDAKSARSHVQDGAAYVGVIGYKYGPVPEDSTLNPEHLSLTEIELNEALKLKRPVLLLVRGGHSGIETDFEADSATRQRLEYFRARARDLVSNPSIGQFYVTFHGPDDFEKKASTAIASLREYLIDRLKLFQEGSQSSAAPTNKTKTALPQSAPTQPESIASQTGSTRKTLVFISASHQDYGWRDRLKSALNSKPEIEWWDDSRISTGSHGLAEIDAAIKRATLAVVFLSPAYISSETAKAELSRLLAQSSSGRLKLFPIMLHEVDWNQLPPAVSKLQIWSMERPVAGLRGTAAKKELEKIAEGIVKSAREFQSSERAVSPKPRRGTGFSVAARKVLEDATALANDSSRSGVNSSCLLFALAQQTGDETSAFVRHSMERTGGYDKALNRFLNDSDSSSRQSAIEVPGLGKASENVAAVLANAANIASRVSLGSTEIFPRHIFASLLVTPEGKTSSIARQRLENLGIDLAAWRREFLEYIRSHVQSENLAGWAAILTSKTFQGGPAGYTSEFCGLGRSLKVEDHLGVKGWADQLAELIALRETKLPLAIGLFGNWGSGKSHFMNLIDKALKSRKEEEKQKGQSAGMTGRWCTEIVPVYFNAWHYLDSNLWASLVAQIFESLFSYLGPKTNELEKVQELLEQASGATARAAEEVKVAEGATTKARSELIVAEQSRLNEETVVDGLLQGLKSLLPEVNSETLQEHAVELLGVKKEVETVKDLREVVEESHSLGVRARALWNKLWRQPGRGWRLGWLMIVILGGAAITGFMAMQIPFLKERVGRPVASMLGGLSVLVLWLRPLLGEARRRLKQMEAWASRAETAQKNARETAEVKEATIKVSAATAKEEAAKMRLAEAMAREALLKEEALNLAPERRLGRFIELKAQSLDYRGQLGLVSLARRDFQELSNIFADRDALNERIANLPAKDKEAETEKIRNLSRSIDRIVLFVDDLDRCQPEKVVEVLQAVHLLLAFPLFAVVVGVDQRCLRQSLRMQFKGLLTQDDGSENGGKGALNVHPNVADEERPATPLDYLEKIFQVPFHLPPMGELGFETLIDRLTAPSQSNAVQIPTEPPKDEQIEEIESPVTQTEVKKAQIDPGGQDSVVMEEQNRKIEPIGGGKVDDIITENPAIPTLEVVGSVPLQQWEREALRDYHPLIRTPRGAKRLLNTYRLVRASVPQSEWGDFSGGGMSDGEFRVAMLLLAAAAGYPALARGWFDRLLNTSPSELFPHYVESDSDLPWHQFQKVYEATFGHITTPLTEDLFVKWVERVERFAF